MKICRKTSIGHLVGRASSRAGSSVASPHRNWASVGAQGTARPTRHGGFTLVEIAICLAIIGVALVAIIGVLPLGMSVQKENREETVINQDATVFIEAIRSGARGMDDLTSYVYAITNYQTRYNPNAGATIAIGYTNGFPSFLTNGLNIIGLLSTPEFTDVNFAPTTNNLFNGGYSNHVVAYVRSLSGPAVDKPPQNNPIIQADAFAYRILCVNAPVVRDTNALALNLPYDKQLAASLRELRLTFLWPQLPNGSLGSGRQTFRTLVAGQMTQIFTNGQWLYFYQPQSFTNVVTAP